MLRDNYKQQPRTRRYEGQQICMNGHLITNYATTHPEDRKNFCPECGKSTVMSCAHCNAPLRGEEIDPEVFFLGGFGFSPPAYCHQCGVPYPWTQTKIETAVELAAQVETDAHELEMIRQSIEDLATETPRTPLAIVRIKRLWAKSEEVIRPAIGKIFMDIASEAIQKQLGLK
jgi:hypothetical protein